MITKELFAGLMTSINTTQRELTDTLDEIEGVANNTLKQVGENTHLEFKLPGVAGPIAVKVDIEMSAIDAALARAAGKVVMRSARAYLEEYLQACAQEIAREVGPLVEDDQDGPGLKVVKEDD